MSVIPTAFPMAPRSLPPRSGTFAVTAEKPRSMLMPWSASPIAESRSVSSTFRSARRWANSSRNRTKSSVLTSLMSRSDAPSQCRRVHGGVPVARHLVVHLQQADRAARHLERGDVAPNQVTVDGEPTLAAHLRNLVVHDVELDERRPAHPVDEGEHVISVTEREIVEDRRHEHLGDLVRGSQLPALAAGLPVDADPDLHLVVADFEGRLPGCRDGAAGQGHPHRPDVVLDALAERLHEAQVLA